jgi:hypothetical protein
LVAVAVIAIAALSLAGWLLLRPMLGVSQSAYGDSLSASDYSDSQQADAKAKVCAAHGIVSNGVSLNIKMAAPVGDGDVTGQMAAAANARISLFFVGEYLLAKLDPATPSELAGDVRTFANNLMDIGAATTAGVSNADPTQAKRLTDTDELNNKIVKLCTGG